MAPKNISVVMLIQLTLNNRSLEKWKSGVIFSLGVVFIATFVHLSLFFSIIFLPVAILYRSCLVAGSFMGMKLGDEVEKNLITAA